MEVRDRQASSHDSLLNVARAFSLSRNLGHINLSYAELIEDLVQSANMVYMQMCAHHHVEVTNIV